MDPIFAFSLASSVISFTDAASRIINAAKDIYSSTRDLQTKVNSLSQALGALENVHREPSVGGIRTETGAQDATVLLESIERTVTRCEKILKRIGESRALPRNKTFECEVKNFDAACRFLQDPLFRVIDIPSDNCDHPQGGILDSRWCLVFAILIMLPKRLLTVLELKEASSHSCDTTPGLFSWFEDCKMPNLESFQQTITSYLGSLMLAPGPFDDEVAATHMKEQLSNELYTTFRGNSWQPLGHETIAIICIKTIIENARGMATNSNAYPNKPEVREEEGADSFLAYSRAFWDYHCSNAGKPSQRLLRSIHEMIQSVFCAEKRHDHIRCNDVTSLDLDRALFFAAKHDFSALGQTYIDMGANIHRRSSKHGETALHVAVAYNNMNMVKLLLQQEAERDARDGRGFTPLHWAAYFGHRNAAKELIDGGADVGAIKAPKESITQSWFELSIPSLESPVQAHPPNLRDAHRTWSCIFSMNEDPNELLPSHHVPTAFTIATGRRNLDVAYLLLQSGESAHSKTTLAGSAAGKAAEDEETTTAKSEIDGQACGYGPYKTSHCRRGTSPEGVRKASPTHEKAKCPLHNEPLSRMRTRGYDRSKKDARVMKNGGIGRRRLLRKPGKVTRSGMERETGKSKSACLRSFVNN